MEWNDAGHITIFTVPREGYIGWWRFWAIHRRATGVRFWHELRIVGGKIIYSL